MIEFGHSWSEAEITLLKKEWLAGAGDEELAHILSTPERPRTVGAINGKRHDLKLQIKFYPERPKTRSFRSTVRNYTEDQDQDILTRYNKGETPADIGKSYGVSRRAMECKVVRLLEKEAEKVATPRPCIRCHRTYLSIHPPKNDRFCQECREKIRENGTSFATMRL